MSDNELPSEPKPVPERQTRRLSDMILIAFHQGCDQDDLEVARSLLQVLEMMSCRSVGRERRVTEGLVAAHERLWHLCHPEPPFEIGFSSSHTGFGRPRGDRRGR